jgi:parvulin-like peptidyl-prolyl isomerase
MNFIPDDIIKIISCSLSSTRHIIEDPVLLSCGHNACRPCVENITFGQKCLYQNCNQSVDTSQELKSVKSIHNLVEAYLNELFKNIHNDSVIINNKLELLNFDDQIDEQFDRLEENILLRFEMLKLQLDKMNKTLMDKLDETRFKLKK